MENIEAMLCAYIEGDLDAAGRAEIEKHLQAHPEHRKLLEELTATRDLVRDLPRVKAPMEVSESLHGHVERSILLDGEQAARSSGGGKRRWTSVLAIAAVFLLGSALCFFVYRVLMPTSRQPAFTEIAASQSPTGADAQRKALLDEDLATAKPQPEVPAAPADGQNSPQNGVNSEVTKDEAAKGIVTAGAANSNIDANGNANMNSNNRANQLAGVARQQDLQTRQMPSSQMANFDDVRNSVKNSGYDIAGVAGAGANPLVLVVNTPNTPQTNQTVTRFLNAAGGSISWSMLSGSDTKVPGAATEPSGKRDSQLQFAKALGSYAASSRPTTIPSADFASAAAGQPATTQPSNQVYIVKGLSRGQAEALRQSFTADDSAQIIEPPAGAAAAAAPTSRPSDDLSTLAMADKEQKRQIPSSTRPEGGATTGVPSTAPSAGPALGGATPADQSVSTVIVVQPAPAASESASPPAPAAPPDTHTDSATTNPSAR
jgi:hypothetical protein